MLALGRFEAKVCDCGFHESFATDRTNHFTFDVRTCPVCKGAAQYQRILNESDEAHRKKVGENRPAATPDPADGRSLRTRVMGPDEVEERRASRNLPRAAQS